MPTEPIKRREAAGSNKAAFGRVATAVVALLAALVLAVPAGAEDDKRASREREALRRAQQALRAVQESQASLQRDKAALTAERDKLDGEAKRVSKSLEGAQAQSRQARSELSRTQTGLATAQAGLEQLRGESERARAAGQARIDDLERRLTEARRQLAERTASNLTVTALLARSTDALADAERKNREMYQLGRKMLDDLRGDAGGWREPFLQFGHVQTENRAEELRSRMDKLIVAPPASAAQAAR